MTVRTNWKKTQFVLIYSKKSQKQLPKKSEIVHIIYKNQYDGQSKLKTNVIYFHLFWRIWTTCQKKESVLIKLLKYNRDEKKCILFWTLKMKLYIYVKFLRDVFINLKWWFYLLEN